MPNHKVKICGLYLYKAYPHWKGDLLQISHKNKAFEPLLQPENSMKTRIFKRFRKDFHQLCFFSSVRYQISAIYDQCFGISSSQEFGLWYRSSSARTECAGESFREPFCATLFWQRSRCFDGFSGLIFWAQNYRANVEPVLCGISYYILTNTFWMKWCSSSANVTIHSSQFKYMLFNHVKYMLFNHVNGVYNAYLWTDTRSM